MKKAGVLLLLLVSLRAPALVSSSPMLAHPVPASGPWFEGWYTRITDPARGLSFAVITASTWPEVRDATTHGYQAVILQTPSQIRALEDFPEQTSLQNFRQDFTWAAGLSRVSRLKTHVEFTKARVDFDIVERAPWSELGPEGPLVELPLPLHWYVDNTVGRARYEIEFDGQVFSGEGFVHQEKNWGEAFPRAWVWSQVTDSGTYLSFAGGDLQTGPFNLHQYLVGYRSNVAQLDFNAGKLSRFEDVIDPCQNEFQLTALSPDYRLEIEARGGADFVSLATPGRAGFVADGARETFTARVHTKLYKRGWISDTLIEERTFENAALEFGGDSQVCR